MGYHRAGFEVVGVDHVHQPLYPFEFVEEDALSLLQCAVDGTWQWDPDWLDGFDAIHASPPCQAFTVYRNNGTVADSPDLVDETRRLLSQARLPYVIENVAGAPLRDPLLLCGSMFDLDIRRHRFFESNVDLEPPVWPCRHGIWGTNRFPGGRSKERTGSSRGLVRGTVEIGTWDIPLERQRKAIGIDWMNLAELSQAVPPMYTEFIGKQLAAA